MHLHIRVWFFVYNVYKKYNLTLRFSLSTRRRLSEKGECRRPSAYTNVKHVNEGQRTEGQREAANAN